MSDAPAKLDLKSSTDVLRNATKPFAVLLEHGDAMVELYSPRGKDAQGPHDRDELYVVASGGGLFRRGEDLIPFAAGDVLFVPAHMPHRFESFSDDFRTWVIFFGPKGGSEASG